MTELILDNIYLMLLLPLWIFLIIMGARFFAIYVNPKIIYILTLLSSLFGACVCKIGLLKLNLSVYQTFEFIRVENFSINCGLHIDKLGLILCLVLFLVSLAVQAFSIPYMEEEPKKYRYYALLNIFNFSMAGLILSPNLFQMYFFWELVGVMSYLLIGFDYKKKEKSEASRRVFLMNRVGDTAFLAGIITTAYLMYNYSGNFTFTQLSLEDMNAISILLSGYTSTPEFWLICGLFIVGAAVKSAQFPFYTWLQDAMEAKLPVSALLHSATMVVAGVYLVIRLLPIFTLDNNIMLFILGIGVLTALICSILACIETLPKKVLAYSTSANLGLMFVALGLNNVKAALIFLIAHAFIKSLLFLSLDENEKTITCVTFLIGALSLSGLIFSGMVSKEVLFMALENSRYLPIVYCVISFFTAFYIMRLPLILLKNSTLENKINWFKFIPIAFLLLLNIVFYFFVRGRVEYQVAEPFWLALIGWGAAYFLYTKNLLTKFSQTPKLLEKIYNNTLVKIYNKISSICNFIDTKIFANYKPIVEFAKFDVKFVNWIEENIMNKSVALCTTGAKKLSELDKKLQKSNVQVYNAYAFIILTLIISLIIVAYTFILNQLS